MGPRMSIQGRLVSTALERRSAAATAARRPAVHELLVSPISLYELRRADSTRRPREPGAAVEAHRAPDRAAGHDRLRRGGCCARRASPGGGPGSRTPTCSSPPRPNSVMRCGSVPTSRWRTSVRASESMFGPGKRSRLRTRPRRVLLANPSRRGFIARGRRRCVRRPRRCARRRPAVRSARVRRCEARHRSCARGAPAP